MAKIFINPGHDINKDPGAVNKITGLREADVALAISKKVLNCLQAEGHEVRLMQDDSLSSVTNQANAWGADIFVSIHCNSFGNPQANGTETLFYPGSSKGRLLAHCIQARMIETFNTSDRGIKERSDLWVLKRTTMPSCLVETAFISNPENEKLLATEDGQQVWAMAIAKGIIDYEKTKGVY